MPILLTSKSNRFAMPARSALVRAIVENVNSMLQAGKTGVLLLQRSDPHPVEVVNHQGGSAVMLVCEHAGRAVPSALRDLGIAAAEMERHIAYDIGADSLSRKLSRALDATLVLQRYSRLVVDCNRPFGAVDCMPALSDGTTIQLNCNLTDSERTLRFEAIHRPFHAAIGRLLDRRQEEGRPTVIATIHSFTPRLANRDRMWQLGVCFNRDGAFATEFMHVFQAANPAILAAYNEPYAVDDISDYTIPVHGERRGLPHLLLEVRNDQILGEDGGERWARLIAHALKVASASLSRELSHGA
jgi:predicted N-formylglutamate amidohydrolase